MNLETEYLKNCKKLSQISGFPIQELFDDVVVLVIDKGHIDYGQIGLLDKTLYGNMASGLGYRIRFSDNHFFDFHNEFREGMPKQLYISKSFEEVLKQKKKMNFPEKI